MILFLGFFSSSSLHGTQQKKLHQVERRKVRAKFFSAAGDGKGGKGEEEEAKKGKTEKAKLFSLFFFFFFFSSFWSKWLKPKKMETTTSGAVTGEREKNILVFFYIDCPTKLLFFSSSTAKKERHIHAEVT